MYFSFEVRSLNQKRYAYSTENLEGRVTCQARGQGDGLLETEKKPQYILRQFHEKNFFLPYIELKKIILSTYIIMPQDYKSSEPMDNLVQEIRENLQLESAVGSNTVTTADQHRDLQLKNHSR